MSLWRRVTLVFFIVNAVTIGLLIGFAVVEGKRIDRRTNAYREAILDRTSRLIALNFRTNIERVFKEKLSEADAGDIVSTAIDIGDLSYWDEDEFVLSHLDKAVLVSYTPTRTSLFNPRRRLLFGADGQEAIDAKEVRTLIEDVTEVSYKRDEAGRAVVYGSFDPQISRNWGFYFRLKDSLGVEDSEPPSSVSAVLWVTIPGTIFLLGFLFLFFSRSVLKPLAATERAALRISAGDYTQPIEYADRTDELGSVSRAVNLMMAELQKHHEHMEGLVDDATDRFKRAERQLVVAQRLAAMGHLAAGFAHEINNPLGGVLNALQTLRRADIDDAKRDKYVDLAEAAVRRIGETVQRVLATTPRAPQVGHVGLVAVVDHAVALIGHRLNKEGVTVESSIDPGIYVLGDRSELSQVFLNLLINALDAIEGDGKVDISARVEAEQVEIRVADDGCGMSAEQRDQAFDLFFTTKPGHKGTGLGLGIVHNIVTGHGGAITVESREGAGTEFTIVLPRGTGDAVGSDEGVSD